MSLPEPIAVDGADAVLTVDEAAKYMKCGRRVVERLVRLKQIKAREINRRHSLRIHRSAIDAFLLGEKRAA
jgi:excisionase family DNA binding protein